MRDDVHQAERLGATQLAPEARDGAAAEARIGRCQVDEVRVVADRGGEPVFRHGGAEPARDTPGERWLSPLAWCLGEQLDDVRADRAAAGRSKVYASGGGDVGAEEGRGDVTSFRHAETCPACNGSSNPKPG
jgi:hypothetical protein